MDLTLLLSRLNFSVQKTLFQRAESWPWTTIVHQTNSGRITLSRTQKKYENLVVVLHYANSVIDLTGGSVRCLVLVNDLGGVIAAKIFRDPPIPSAYSTIVTMGVVIINYVSADLRVNLNFGRESVKYAETKYLLPDYTDRRFQIGRTHVMKFKTVRSDFLENNDTITAATTPAVYDQYYIVKVHRPQLITLTQPRQAVIIRTDSFVNIHVQADIEILIISGTIGTCTGSGKIRQCYSPQSIDKSCYPQIMEFHRISYDYLDPYSIRWDQSICEWVKEFVRFATLGEIYLE